jgi:hypothetical protein
MGVPIPGSPVYAWVDVGLILTPLLPNDAETNKYILQWVSLTYPLSMLTLTTFCGNPQPTCPEIMLGDMQNGGWLGIYEQCALAQFWYENCM